MSRNVPVTSLYVHVPFCAQKCHYCAFYSQPGTPELKDRFVRALKRELEMVAPDLRPQTLFFGGGTPSLLSFAQWKDIFSAMEKLGLLGALEWTIETNPATVSKETAALWRSFGVNRVSMGVQSFDPTLLERLGRIHSRDQVFASFELLRSAGFDNLALDLMFAIPGQTLPTWRDTLDQAIALQPEHLSCYEIIYEEDTPFFRYCNLQDSEANQDAACAMYEELLAVAEDKGFRQYEVANFARHLSATPAEIPDRACRHNINYWRGGDFHGLGPSAAGYISGVRTKNVANTVLYCERLEQGQRPIESTESLSPLARAGELAAFGLRMTAGWPLAEFKDRTGFDLVAEWKSEVEKLVALGYAECDSRTFRLTSRGLRYADWAAEMFLR